MFGIILFDVLTHLQPASSFWPRLLVFWIFGRGFVDLICWFWVNDDAPKLSHRKGQSDAFAVGTNVNMNRSLQKEMTV